MASTDAVQTRSAGFNPSLADSTVAMWQGFGFVLFFFWGGAGRVGVFLVYVFLFLSRS